MDYVVIFCNAFVFNIAFFELKAIIKHIWILE